MTDREKTIKYTLPNLRFRWAEELKPYSDNAVAAMYEDFYFSDDAGNNDENLPKWFDMLPSYEEKGHV